MFESIVYDWYSLKYELESAPQTYRGSIKSFVYLDKPKSHIFAVQSSFTRMLAGFKSL